MNEYSAHLRALYRVTMFFLGICLLMWSFMPDYRPQLSGLIIGMIVSFVNALYLAWKVKQFAQAAIDNTGRRVNLGFISRGAMAVLGVMIAQHYGFTVWTTVAGLFFAQLVTLLLGIISNWKTSRK